MRSNAAHEGERLRAVEHHHRNAEILQMGGAMKVEIGGDSVDAGLEGLRGLVSGGGAEVEKRLARFEAQQRHDGLRADILDARRRACKSPAP